MANILFLISYHLQLHFFASFFPNTKDASCEQKFCKISWKLSMMHGKFALYRETETDNEQKAIGKTVCPRWTKTPQVLPVYVNKHALQSGL